MARPGPPRNVGAESDKSRISHRATLLIKQLVAGEQGKKASGGGWVVARVAGHCGCGAGSNPPEPDWGTVKSWEECQRDQDIEEEGGTAILLMTM